MQSAQKQFIRLRWPVAVGIGLALTVLAGTVAGSVLYLRQRIRGQIANRDGESLDAIAEMQYLDDKASEETISPLDDPGEQIHLALKISRMRSVLGVRLFSRDGKFVNAFPAHITEASLPLEDLAELQKLKPVSHFNAQARLQEHYLLAITNESPVPLLVVNVPLHEEDGSKLVGVAQFIMNGTSIAREYGALDRHVALQGALAFAVGGSILASGLALAFWRVQHVNRLLAERTANLLKANRELALAAKTTAVGTLTSHLIHGLKNPLSGLKTFVRNGALGQTSGQETDWELAVATTRRMESLINRVVGVLQQCPAADYEVSFVELSESLTARLAPAAREAGVRLETAVTAAGAPSNREAELLLLILENLVQNAIEATPPGKTVRLTVVTLGERTTFEVQDEGPGLPPEIAQRLFTPCISTKKGGTGIGLAISRQLATHLGAELELKHSSAQGSSFRLTLATDAQKSKQALSGSTSG
jgi:signal transduction histidine kinase